MEIVVQCPQKYSPERAYILSELLEGFFGFCISIEFTTTNCYRIKHLSKEIVFPDIFFPWADSHWLKRFRCSPPVGEPIRCNINGLDFIVPRLFPAISGEPFFRRDSNSIEFTFDLFGSCFFLMTLYEEIIAGEQDHHGRILRASLPSEKHRLRDSPVVNIYLELFWKAVLFLYPAATRKERTFRLIPTHDVDNPGAAYLGRRTMLRAAVGHARRLHFGAAATILRWLVAGSSERDPLNTFSWLMDRAEENNTRAEFYFLTRSDSTSSRYSLSDPYIRQTIESISQRGHVIGLHGSYDSHCNQEYLEQERSYLSDFLAKIGAPNSAHLGGRQHYLRFLPRESWRHQTAAGLAFDSSVYFAESAGFRTGCCFSYQPYDFTTRRKLVITERPLTLMEATFLEMVYGNGGPQGLLQAARKAMDQVRAVNGEFVLLWHNCRLVESASRHMLEKVYKLADK